MDTTVSNELKFNKMIEKALETGAFRANVIETGKIVTDASFRDSCAANICGVYGKCWMCPPDVGEIHELMAKVYKYTHAMVYQKVYPLEDSFDIEGMTEARNDFKKLVFRMKKTFNEEGMFHLGAGGCGVCEICSKREDLPCRFPELAVSSLEAHGINVSELAKSAGMNYINGQDTVTYFGAVFFNS